MFGIFWKKKQDEKEEGEGEEDEEENGLKVPTSVKRSILRAEVNIYFQVLFCRSLFSCLHYFSESTADQRLQRGRETVS